ncbi:MAG: HEAT repeat domain-containing protein [Planctomycetota bacterium]|nr:MAG: HEAT repeat domain-containing protein [Planctomycetota bacterium]
MKTCIRKISLIICAGAVIAAFAGCANGERNGNGGSGRVPAKAIVLADVLEIREHAASRPGSPPEHIILIRVKRVFGGETDRRVLNVTHIGDLPAGLRVDAGLVMELTSVSHGIVVLESDGSAFTVMWHIRSGPDVVRPATPELLEKLEKKYPEDKTPAAAGDSELSRAENIMILELFSLLGREGNGAAARREALVKKLKRAAVRSLVLALQNKDARVRRNSAVLLGIVYDDRAASALGKLFKDRNPRVRLAAAWALERAATRPALRALERYLTDSEEEARVAAYNGFGYAGEPATVAVVVLGLRDVLPRVRRAAARSLGFLKNPDAMPDIARALEVERDRRVMMALLTACGRIKSKDSRCALAKAMASKNAAVREAAVEALALHGTNAAPMFLAGMESENVYLRWMCAEELRRITRHSCGYEHDAEKKKRKASIRHWREYLKSMSRK